MVQKLGNPALHQMWVLDAQWTDCPEEVEKEVEALWRYHELGNDNFMLRRSIKDLKDLEGCEVEEWDNKTISWVKTPLDVRNLIAYLYAQNIPEDEQIIIHWWW